MRYITFEEFRDMALEHDNFLTEEEILILWNDFNEVVFDIDD